MAKRCTVPWYLLAISRQLRGNGNPAREDFSDPNNPPANVPAFVRNAMAATAHMRTNPPLSLEGATFSGPVITQEMVPAVGEDIMTPHGEANVTAVEAGRVRVRIKSNERSDEDEAHYDYHWVALADVKKIHVPLQVGDDDPAG